MIDNTKNITRVEALAGLATFLRWRVVRITGGLMLAALMVYGGLAPGPQTHPTCQTTMPVLMGKVTHGQPLTERELKWYRDCRGKSPPAPVEWTSR